MKKLTKDDHANARNARGSRKGATQGCSESPIEQVTTPLHVGCSIPR